MTSKDPPRGFRRLTLATHSWGDAPGLHETAPLALSRYFFVHRPDVSRAIGGSGALYTTSTSILETSDFRNFDRTSASNTLGSTPAGM